VAQEHDELGAAVRAAAAEARDGLGPHLTPEELVIYHEGLVEGPESERLQDHLALCRACTGLLLELETFPGPQPEDAAERLSDRQVDDAWTSFQARRAQADVVPAQPTVSWRAVPQWVYAAAAIWFVATVGLGMRLAGLTQRVEQLSQPRVNVALADLSPLDEAVRDAQQSWRPVRLAAGQAHALLALHAPGASGGALYRAELVEVGRQRTRTPRWSHPALHTNADGLFTLQFARRSLPAGRYLLRLSTEGGPALEYRFEVFHD